MATLLQSIRVLDLSRVLAGPYCTMLLGDLGAQVIKVERPGCGDDTRAWGPPFIAGESAYFLCTNRNKQSITLDLKSPAGRDVVLRLAACCDVLVENFMPGTLDRLGLGWEQVSAVNPRMVFCSITGFGQDGPCRDAPGYDIMIQAMSGVMSITGQADGPPTKVGVAISDITAGLFACNAILAALVSRGRTGRGERIDISLLDSSVAWLANVGANYLATGEVPERPGNAHANIVPYQAFDTADRPIVVAVGNDGQWQRFCAAVERGDLANDPQFATNPLRVQHRQELIPQLQRAINSRTADEWLARLAEAGVPSAAVNTLDRVFRNPQVQARRMLVEVQHPTAGRLPMAGSPFKLSNSGEVDYRPPPRLGEHTECVLRDVLGMSGEQIAALGAGGALGRVSQEA
jgi:formyl-CoA transferase